MTIFSSAGGSAMSASVLAVAILVSCVPSFFGAVLLCSVSEAARQLPSGVWVLAGYVWSSIIMCVFIAFEDEADNIFCAASYSIRRSFVFFKKLILPSVHVHHKLGDSPRVCFGQVPLKSINSGEVHDEIIG